VAVEPDQVAAFLGKPDDAATLDTAEQAIPIVTVMVKAYVRGTGEGWEPNDELSAVIVTASARMVSNPGQLPYDLTAWPHRESPHCSPNPPTVSVRQAGNETAPHVPGYAAAL
jgi:hypothetical protein